MKNKRKGHINFYLNFEYNDVRTEFKEALLLIQAPLHLRENFLALKNATKYIFGVNRKSQFYNVDYNFCMLKKQI
ncbi:hypothetical protein T10_12170 [Trichinella papuae]|uniref:Uncharacterized protein n=1 Tax=Trichinella papuae TaxID=268474 RepID=A0A0V1NAQ7_9BILA|nr:hypothetical protein T10_12170 [Trichinella papuae]